MREKKEEREEGRQASRKEGRGVEMGEKRERGKGGTRAEGGREGMRIVWQKSPEAKSKKIFNKLGENICNSIGKVSIS